MKNNEFPYRLNPSLSWAVEINGIILFSHSFEKACFISYPHASLWDFIDREISLEEMIIMISAINGTDEKSAERWIKDTLQKWEKEEWIVKK